MPAFLRTLIKSLGYVFATVIIIAATMVCISRLLTPVLEQHRADFEAMASRLLHSPVTISEVRASWYQYQPELSLEGVTVYDPRTNKPVLQVQDIKVFVSIPQSIWQRQFVVGGVMISGTALNINKDSAGNITVQGFPQLGNSSTPYSDQAKLEDMLAWMSQEPRTILHDIDLHYTASLRGHGDNVVTRYVSLHDLSIENTGTTHTIVGTATLHQKIPTKISLALQWKGANLDPGKITAQGYLYVSGLDLSQWLKGMEWHGWEIKQGITSSKIWVDFRQGALQKVQVLTQAYGLEFYSKYDDSLHAINRLSGNFGWRQQDKNQVFAGEDILIDMPSHLWPVSSFYVSMQPDANGDLQPQMANIGYINLADVTKFLISSQDVTEQQRQALTGLKLSGNLQNTTLNFARDWENFYEMGFNTSFDQINISQWNKFPGIANLAGTVKWDGKQGAVNLDSKQVEFEDSIFSHELNLNQLKGTVALSHGTDNIWHFTVPKMQIANDDANASVSGTLVAPPGISPLIDMKADFNLQHAENISNYLPLQVFDKDLTGWIKQAFLSGSAYDGHAVLRGLLNEFPYDGGNGEFLISGKVANVTLKYAPDWPVLKDIDANLVFSGRKVTIDASHGEIMDIPVSNVHAVIPYMGEEKPSVLTVESPYIDADFTRGFKFIHASPLESTIGKMFRGVDLTGPVTLKLGLTIPLSKPDTTQVRGDMTINDAGMNMPEWGLNINHLGGDLKFTEKSVSAERINGELFGKPLQFGLKTISNAKDDSYVQANFKNNLSIADLEKWLQIPFSKVATGAADVSGKINFALHKPMEIQLNSNLVGVALDVPQEYGKKEEEARDFSLELSMPVDQPIRLMVNYNDSLSAAMLITSHNKTFKLTAADLHLGSGLADWPDTTGLYVTANFKNLDWANVQKYMSGTGASDVEDDSALVLRGAEVQADNLKIGAMNLPDIRIQVWPEKSEWVASVDSPDISGQLQIPKILNEHQTLVAYFDKLTLHSFSDEANKLPDINVKSLPAIIFTSKKTSYDGKPLGQVSIRTIPTDTGLNIQTLLVNSQNISLRASGKWTQTNNSSTTQLKGSAVSKQVDNFLKSFGYDTHNVIVNDGTLDFNLGWGGAPYEFALKNLTGSLKLSLGKGRIADIGQETEAKMDLGRMLSIFSLQTIPRRLSGDFSDVFEKGYSFDTVRGDFTTKNGSLYTSNFKFNGPVAMVGINGRIGLLNKDYDFTLVVTPYITSSIPVAALMLSQPLIGLAAFAVNNVIGPSLISKATSYYYTVTGPWVKPSWKSVSVNQRMRVS